MSGWGPYHKGKGPKGTWKGYGKHPGYRVTVGRVNCGSWGQDQTQHSQRLAHETQGGKLFDFSKAVPLSDEPTVVAQATYTYAHKSSAVCDVLSPAWSVRKLQLPAHGSTIDLSLERGLAGLQQEDGGFELTTELAAVLGLQETSGALDLADDVDARAYGALLALKTVWTYCREQLAGGLICQRAEKLACDAFQLDVPVLRRALQTAGTSPEPPPELPSQIVEVLKANFAPPGRWSFFELWAKLLPVETLKSLRKDGAVLCPRFFLVDLACAPMSPYDVDKSYPLVRQGACLFVGQPPDDVGHHDAMRQGRHLEATICSYAWLEEDHVLTEVILPGTRAIFSAAPDAVLGDGTEGIAEDPLPAGDEEGYEIAGYSLDDDFPVLGRNFERCRIWRGEHPPVPTESYVEVKKTTHLKGQAGQFKLLKFWLQAALMACGTVVVATTDGSSDGDVVNQTEQFSLEKLRRSVQAGKVWGSLVGMLQYVLAETAAAEGQWTLRVQKARGPHSHVRLSLCRGWQGQVSTDDPSSVLEQLSSFFVGTLPSEAH